MKNRTTSAATGIMIGKRDVGAVEVDPDNEASVDPVVVAAATVAVVTRGVAVLLKTGVGPVADLIAVAVDVDVDVDVVVDVMVVVVVKVVVQSCSSLPSSQSGLPPSQTSFVRTH